jgi:S1-C subfamily serine protease
MTVALNSAVVRIRATDGRMIGVGFLVGQRQILTCAHVIAQALDLPEDAPESLQCEVLLDFPLIAPGYITAAHIIHWQPQRDVVGLELDGDPPTGIEAAHLVKADDLWSHSFRAFGFPAGHNDGVWASGVLRGQTAAGWAQIEDIKKPGYRVQPGFSGTPVWDEQLSGVIGMAVAADADRVTKVGFVIPTDQLSQAWPDMAERSLYAGSLEHLEAQLAMFQAAQYRAPDPRRFQAKIDELQAAIAGWDSRVKRRRQRINQGGDYQNA